jgi:transposase
MISKSFKFRLITTSEQDATFSQWADSCPFVYHRGLGERKKSVGRRRASELCFAGLFFKRSPCSDSSTVFKKKGQSTDSFRFPDPSQFSIERINGKKSFLDLPKIDCVTFYQSRKILGEIKNGTISREGRYWFVSFNCEGEQEVPENLGSAIGLDRGVVTYLVTSENKKYALRVEPIQKQEER